MSEVQNAENSANQTTAQAATPAPIVIKVSEILTDLHNGLTREQIRLKLGLTKGQLVEVFKNPKLKGRKTRVILSGFVVEDDTETETEATQVATNEVAPATPQRTPRASRAANTEVEAAPEAEVEKEEEAGVAPAPTEAVVETPEVEEVKEEDEKSPWDR